MRAFRTESALESLGWLDVGQTAAKATIITALKVLYEGKQEDLLERIAVKDKKGGMKVKNVSKTEFLSMNNWMRKAWSTRARRWLKKLPQELLERNPWADSTKKVVRNWVKDNVNIKGEDAILWGKWDEDDLECERLEEGACPKPYWTEKQMRRRGEPQRKRMRLESMGEKQPGGNDQEEELCREAERMTQNQEDGGGKGGEPELRNGRKEGRINMKEQKLIRAERRERWRVKKAIKEKNKKERERKKQELKEEMVRKGRESTRKQYTLRLWAIGGGPLGKEGKGKEKDGDKENKWDTRDKKQPREGEGEVKKGIG